MNVNADDVIAKMATRVGMLTAELAIQTSLAEQLQRSLDEAVRRLDETVPTSDGE